MTNTVPMARALRLLLLLVLLAGAALRFGAAAFTIVDEPIRADASQYYAYARNLVDAGVYSMSAPGSATPVPDAVRPPGYALFLAPFAALLPEPETFLSAVLFAQALLGVLLIQQSFVLAARVLPHGWALAVALLVALSPHLVSLGTYLLTEALFALLLVAGLLQTLRALDGGRVAQAIGAGALLGAAAMTRATLNYLPVALLLLALLPGLRHRYGRTLLVVALTLALPLVLWGLRNLLVTGHWSDPTLSMNMLHHGMYPDFMYDADPRSYGMPYRFDPDSARITSGIGEFWTVLRERFAADPGTYWHWYLWGKLATFLQWSIVAGQGDVFVYPVIYSPYYANPNYIASYVLMYWLHLPLVWLGSAAALVFCVRALRGRPVDAGVLLLALVVVYFLLLHIVGAPFPRYRIPLQPVLYVLALAALHALWQRRPGARQP